MGIIYKITNKINDKIYIGQTMCTFEKRWSQHISASKSENPNVTNTYFIRAIRKYGADAFAHEILEECPNDQLNDREVYWIKHYNSTDPKIGYNICTGGHSRRHYYHFDQIYDLWDKGLGIGEIAKRTDISRATLRHILGSYSNYSKEESRRRGLCKIHQHQRKLPVSQYTIDGEYIASYESTHMAQRMVAKTSSGQIARCCKTHEGLSGGYQWRFVDDEPPPPMENIPGHTAVIQYDKQGNFIKRYRSMLEASQETGTQFSSISLCCRDVILSAGGYKWAYAD